MAKETKRTTKRRVRRRFLVAAGLAGAGLVAARFAIPRWLRPDPVRDLPLDLAAFAERTLAGIDPTLAWDVHAHVVGSPEGGNGCWVNPAMREHRHPILRLQYDAYLAATGIRDPERADAEYMARLLDLQRRANPEGRVVLLAFDFAVGEDGREDREHSAFHVPDAYVLRLAREHREVEAAISVHPYREDAVERVRNGAAAGAVAIKWLPNAMGIDPASPRCDAFYEAAATTGLPLIVHVGAELAVRSEHHALGNPLLLRRALEHGVRVVIAHAGSFGEHPDLDAGGPDGPEVPSFDLAMRLMREPAWADRLYADTSAITTVNRCGEPLRELLLADDLHGRLLYGSDYPMTAIGPLVSTWLLQRRGYIEGKEAEAVDAIRERNPLLADRVLQRLLRARDAAGHEHRFPPSVFETARTLAPAGGVTSPAAS